VSFTPLQSPLLHIRRRCSQRQRLPWGCGPSSRHDRPASVLRDSQPRGLSVLGVSHAPDGLLRLPARGFVSPHCHVQGLPFREFPSRTAEPLRQRLVPSRRWAAPRCLGCPKRHTSSPRPQGFHPCESPWLRRRGLAVAEARFPRGLLLLQVLRPDVALMPSHQLPLVTLMRARRCRSRTGLQRSLPPSPTSSPEAADLLEVLCRPPIASFGPGCWPRQFGGAPA